jgi:transposase
VIPHSAKNFQNLFTYTFYHLHFHNKFIINMPPKTARRELEQSTKDKIIGMDITGWSCRKIAEKLDLDPSTVTKVVKRYKLSGSTENSARPGRPKKMTERDHRHLVDNVKKNRHATLQDITNSMPSKVSVDTVRRALHNQGINSRIAAKKPFINQVNQAKRLVFAREHQRMTIDDWKNVLWTDESSFEIGKNSRQVHVWRTEGERFNSSCLTPSFKSGRQTVMVWGCFMWGKRGPLVILPKGSINGPKYVEVMEEAMLDFWMEQSEERGFVVIQEDNAPIHTCKLAKKWRESREMVSLTWPPNSPDLNPIEHIWYLLKGVIQKANPRPMTLPDLKDTIQKAWDEYNMDIMDRLVESMPARIAAVIEAHGGNTKY